MTVTVWLRVAIVALTVASGCRDEPGSQKARTQDSRRNPTPPSRESKPADLGLGAPPRADGPPIRKDGTVYGDAELMGTRVSLNVWVGEGGRAAQAGEAMQAALDEMARIEDIMSEWRPRSELSRLSAAAGKAPMTVSPELFEVLQVSKRISEATEGAFDVTFHGVGQLWSFGPGATPPKRELIATKLSLVDYRGIELDEEAGTVRLRKPGMMIGLGAIAKGYAVDRASKVLDDRGFPNHVVEGGGDTYAAGTKGGRPWMIGVQAPDGPGSTGVIPTSDEAVVTSGNYQRYFEHEGKRYAHILDPKTGWPLPAESSPKSVTVVADNATVADAYGTALAVMGVERAKKYAEENAEIEAVIIDADGAVHVSSGLRDRFVSAQDAAHPLEQSKPRTPAPAPTHEN